MSNVETFAREYGLMPVIDRACSFHPLIKSALLATPCEWNLRLHSSAGYYHSERGITLHLGLKREGSEATRATFLHEVAHAMQWLRYREVNHGASWLEMMHQLGQQPKRTHSYAACGGPARSNVNPDDIGL